MSRKAVIITGCTSGIGEATARVFHQEGFKIYGVARDPVKLDALDFPLEHCEVADLANPKSWNGLLCDVNAGDWDELVLVNNAGTFEPAEPVLDLSYESLLPAFNLNYFCPVFLSRKFYKALLSAPRPNRRARIVNISTGLAFHPSAGWAAYCGSKAALWSFTGVFALEMDPAICQIVSLAPGVVETKMQAFVRSLSPEKAPDVVKFQKLAAEGKIFPPEKPARYIFELIHRMPFPHGQHIDIRKD